MELDAPGLENALVSLEPFSSDHRELLHKSGAVDAMWTWMPMISTGTSYDSYFDHALLQAKRGDMVPFALFRPGTHEFLGIAAFLDPHRTHRRIQITHLWLVPGVRGNGVFTAVQSLMIQRAIDWGARRIVWLADERNAVAIKAFRKLGGTEEGLAREYQRMADGHWANMIVFSMLRPEARDAVVRLNRRLAEFEGAD